MTTAPTRSPICNSLVPLMATTPPTKKHDGHHGNERRYRQQFVHRAGQVVIKGQPQDNGQQYHLGDAQHHGRYETLIQVSANSQVSTGVTKGANRGGAGHSYGCHVAPGPGR